MPRSRTRRMVDTGIYEDPIGYQAQVNGGRGKGNARRFPKTATLSAMRRWQRDRRAELALTPTAPVTQGQTLKAAAALFMTLLPTGKRRDRLDDLLACWIATPLGAMRRSDITRADVKRELASWGSAGGRTGTGFAASTLNHRLSALRTLYRELDGDDAPNPATGIKKFAEPEPEPRGVPIALAERVLAYIADRGGVKAPILVTKARVRLRVILFTGLPHGQVMQIERKHIDWERHTLTTTPRRKGKGARPRVLPLLPQAVEALKEFDAINAYGPFSTSPVRRAWNEAKKKIADKEPALAPILKGLRPYDLRHSFLTAMYASSGDHRATGDLGLHADDRTTRRYTLSAVSERTRKAVEAMAAATQAVTAKS